jgi:hypothetical protein
MHLFWLSIVAAVMLGGMNDESDKYCRGMELLKQGKWEQGWRLFESRPVELPTKQEIPIWDGSPVGTLLIRIEQGRGDLFQFARYLPLAANRCKRLVLSCPIELHQLLRGLSFVDRIELSGRPLPCDGWARVMSLPLRLGLMDPDRAPKAPYLSADRELSRKWRVAMSPLEHDFKVGICWQGNPSHQSDNLRSIPLAAFIRLAEFPKVVLLSLQKQHGMDQLAGNCPPVVDLSSRLDIGPNAFMDTAAVIANLDLVITADTAVAHLAGAMGVPVWVAISSDPDWRWGVSGETTPWYPSMRLFRQSSAGNWSEVFDRIALALGELANGSAVR